MLKYKIEMAPLGNRIVVAARDFEKGTVEQVFTLNKSAAGMLRMLADGLDAEALTERIAREYNAPAELIKRDVEAFLKDLSIRGLIG